jgi:type I restriction-modification system DNA methylase subunit
MKTPLHDDPDTLVLKNLDGTFHSLLDEARSSHGLHKWPEALGLMALRFIAGDPIGPDKWAQVMDTPSSYAIHDSIRTLGHEIEGVYEDLGGVFTKALLSGLERIDVPLLRAWTWRLSQLSRISVDASIFGKWLSGALSTMAMEVREAGEVTTPPSVARLIVELADIPNGGSVFDPCCGVGTVLAAAVERAQQEKQAISIFGQELMSVNWALCRLRLFLLGHNASNIMLGDSLRQPAFVDNQHLHKFDRVVCDAPIGMSLRDPHLGTADPYHRFVFSQPGRGLADNAFVQHALASMSPDGRAVLLVSHGLLFRSGAEARVREGLINSGLVQAVIGLPPKLRPMTAIETALIILGRNATGKITLVDASAVQPTSRGRMELASESIQRILELVHSPGQAPPSLVRSITPEELIENDFNLVPRRYLSAPVEDVSSFEVDDLWEQVSACESTARRTAEEMDALFKQLSK